MPGIPPDKIPPTIGMNLAKINYKGTQVIIWDLGGQIKMRNIWEKYYETAHAIIFMVDSADIGRLEEAKLAYGEYAVIFAFKLYKHRRLNISFLLFLNVQRRYVITTK